MRVVTELVAARETRLFVVAERAIAVRVVAERADTVFVPERCVLLCCTLERETVERFVVFILERFVSWRGIDLLLESERIIAFDERAVALKASAHKNNPRKIRQIFLILYLLK